MSIRTAARLAVAAGMLVGLSWQAGPAAADSSVSVSDEIRVGNSGTLGGAATFLRTLRDDGTEELVARAHLLRPSVKSSICLSHDPFIHRRSWDTCPQKIEQTSDVTYTLNLGTEYAGSVVHIQFRVRMPEFADKPDLANGYAGWHPVRHPDDQYGEVAIPPLGASPSPSSSPSPSISPSPSTTSSPSGSPSPSTSPTASPSPSGTVSPSPSSTSGSGVLSNTASAGLAPTAVNAGSGGGAAPRPPLLPALLLLGGLGLAAASGRRLARGR